MVVKVTWSGGHKFKGEKTFQFGITVSIRLTKFTCENWVNIGSLANLSYPSEVIPKAVYTSESMH